MDSNWEKDNDMTRKMEKFIEREIYSNREIFSKFSRINDIVGQKSGVDAIISTTDGRIVNANVDEKVAYTWANKFLQTFAFEIKSRRNEGWLVNDKLKTQYYLLVWINYAGIPSKGFEGKYENWDVSKLDENNIKIADYVLISSGTLKKYLEEHGLSCKRLLEIADEIRASGKYRQKIEYNGFRFTYGTIRDDGERPINILIGKEPLREMAVISGTVGSDKWNDYDWKKIKNG